MQSGVRFALAALMALLATSCQRRSEPQPDYVAQIRAWQVDRVSRLKARDGWLNLAGLYWLRAGENRFGSAPDNDLVFPLGKAPAYMGVFRVSGDRVWVSVNPGVAVQQDGMPISTKLVYSPETARDPVVLQYGSLAWFVIERDGRLAVRLRDYQSPALQNFSGIKTFPIDPAWRLEAHLRPYDPPKILAVPTVLGTVRREASPGALVFEYAGQTYTLDVVSEEGDQFFVVFADATTGKETYGGGRFLYVDKPGPDGKTHLDFNKAYNPPCAFSAYSTCPLPPEQNRLPFPVTAGEKTYRHRTS